MASVTQLGYLELGVSDVAGWERFATDILGLASNGVSADGSLSLRMDEYSQRFVLRPGSDDLNCLGWEVVDRIALQELAAKLKGAGFESRPGTRAETQARRVVELIKLSDPSGIACEAFYGPLMNYEEPFKPSRSITGFVAGSEGLGHVVIAVDNFEKSLAFYRDVLGMRVSDYVEIPPEVLHRDPREGPAMAVFFHCNPRHHSLAFVEAPKSPKRLHHFMLEAASLDDVGRTYYLCQERSVPIAASLGKHTNDHMVSFYLRSPSGFQVEFGWGGRLVDDHTWQVQSHRAPNIWGHQPVP
jgi:3,4-dihydroxy-9,10-secoandrosta-1,3,5(10)-triene-9,17-dione 4,5-dioxygenase